MPKHYFDGLENDRDEGVGCVAAHGPDGRKECYGFVRLAAAGKPRQKPGGPGSGFSNPLYQQHSFLVYPPYLVCFPDNDKHGLVRHKTFDPSFVVLAMFASVEAIFLSKFVFISQNRMAAQTDKQADLYLNLVCYHNTKLPDLQLC